MEIEERIDRIEEAISIIKTLLVNHDDRLEDYFNALQRSREDFEFKMNAVIDMQMRNEVEIRELKEASKLQLTRIENLENK
jgi:predicted RNase H-like nuclease (RuvC/YqgF family)